MREQDIILKHESDRPLFRGGVKVRCCERSAIKFNRPVLKPFKPGGDAKKRRLAATRWSKKANNFARRRIKAGAINDKASAKGMAYVAQNEAHKRLHLASSGDE
jgi:hypothetical protein